MTTQMTHRERVLATLKGQDVDRPPVSMWRHFFGKETSPEGLAEAMLSFQHRFDWDFMKVNPRASYHAEGWGLKTRYDGDRPPQVVETPIREPDDWLRVDVLGLDTPVLQEHLHALELISRDLQGEVPFLMTVFTPVSITAALAASEELFLQHLREHTDKVRHALEAVTETFIHFSRACLERGAAGLFYATTSWATAQYVRLVHATGRWRTLRGDIPARLWEHGEPFILAFWHGRLLMMPYCCRRGRRTAQVGQTEVRHGSRLP